MAKNSGFGIKDIAIVVAILALLFLLAQLFLQPRRPARDLVFGDLGRMHSAVTNLTESTSEPTLAPPTTNSPAAARPSPELPQSVSNDNAAMTTPTEPTNDPLSNAVAAAIAAPPIAGTQPSSLENGAQQLPSPPALQDARPVVTAFAPAPPVTFQTKPPAPPYTPPPTPEPDTKTSTADLLKGDFPGPADAGPTRTVALLGVELDKTPSPSTTHPVAAPSRHAPAFTSETNVSFVVDQSLSMRKNGKSDRARSEVLHILETMAPTETFYVLFFHSGGYEGMPGLGPVPATPENIRDTTNWLFSVGHRFGSDPAKGIRRALGLIPAPDTVWLISDGGFSKNAVQTIREANETVNAHINTVALYSAEGEPVMREIADENRGICRYIAPPP